MSNYSLPSGVIRPDVQAAVDEWVEKVFADCPDNVGFGPEPRGPGIHLRREDGRFAYKPDPCVAGRDSPWQFGRTR